MKEINMGQLVSLIHCKKCGSPIEINANQENVMCDICKENNNLKVNIGIDMATSKDITFRGIQKHAQCIRCINRNSSRCMNKDKFLIRECKNFIPMTDK